MFFPMSSLSEYPEISSNLQFMETITPVGSVSTDASLRQRRSITERSLAFSLRIASTSCLSKTFSRAKERMPCFVSSRGMTSRTHSMTSLVYGRFPYPPSNDERAEVKASDMSLRSESWISFSESRALSAFGAAFSTIFNPDR